MGFVAGLGHPGVNCGVPTYYMHSGPTNTWDANTYATVYFDGSGSMNSIITPLTNAMGGDYFSSGSAAGGDGVKSTTSLRAILQDLYATGGIEGSPDYNTNNATNGSDEFEKHVQFINLGSSERPAEWLTTPYKYNGSATWPASPTETTYDDSDFITPSNFVAVAVCNESKISYHDGHAGSTWSNTEITGAWQSNINALKTAISAGGAMDSHAAGTDPSFTAVILDPGYNGTNHVTGESFHDGPVYQGIQTTASQALWAFGAMEGQGSYAPDAAVVGQTYSLVDFSPLAGVGMMAWNNKTNAIVLKFLEQQSNNTSVSFWRNKLLESFQVNLLIPGAY